MSKAPTISFRTSDIRIAALAYALAEARLESVDEQGGSLTFCYSGVPLDFQLRLIRGDVMLNGRDVLRGLESVHGLLQEAKRRQGGRR